MAEISDEELQRRVQAARGYMGMLRPAFAKHIGVSVPTLVRMETEAPPAETARKYLDRIVQRTPLPSEFFIVDFSQLRQLEPGSATAMTPAEVLDEIQLTKARLATLEAAMLPPSEEEPPATGDPQTGQQQ